MQFGLSCFTRLDDLQYKNRTYNFYIFPQPHQGHGDIDRTFSLQAHAIQFLTEHGFDFNKLFKHGVSYLTFQEKKLLTAQLKSDMKARSKVEFNSNGLPKFVPTSMSSNCRDWMNRVQKFIEQRKKINLANMAKNDSSDSVIDNQDSEMRDSIQLDKDVLEIRDCSTNHKRNIMKRVLECLPIFENMEVGQKLDSEKNETYLVVNYIDKKLKSEKQKNALVVAKGFLEVLELVILNKKPLVGHNLALDLIQIINQFMEPLSNDYDSFKETCHSLFPLIYDTKFIAHSVLDPETLTNNQSRLNDLYCQLRNSQSFPKIRIEHLGEFFDENQVPHQAGYDAYMSGYCFIALCEGYIRESKRHKYNKKDEASSLQPISIAKQCQVVEEFANKIHLSYSYDFKYFNLSGDDEEPDRNHVFYIEFPSTWVLDDIFQVFSQYGGVTACKLNKTSALCALRDPKQTDAVLKKAKKLKESTSNYKIFSYDTYLDSYKPKKKKETCGDYDDVEFSDS